MHGGTVACNLPKKLGRDDFSSRPFFLCLFATHASHVQPLVWQIGVERRDLLAITIIELRGDALAGA